jgi:hypothetical protein
LSPLLFNFALEYAIKKMQENQVGLKLIGTHQLLAYAGDVILLGDNIGTMTNNRHLSLMRGAGCRETCGRRWLFQAQLIIVLAALGALHYPLLPAMYFTATAARNYFLQFLVSYCPSDRYRKASDGALDCSTV